MRWVRAATVAAALAVMAQAAEARVPAFVRQTGLVCNQCHVNWGPVMDFTFTGMKFRLNGFRTPWVAEKVEAGDEGAVNGQRLVLTLGSMLSWHVRGLVVGGGKAASDPSLPEPNSSSPNSQLIQTIGMHYAGPIGEHIGIWNEFYMYGGGLGPVQGIAPAGARNGYIGLSHFSMVLTTNSNGNTLGFEGQLLPSPGAHDFMQLNNDPTPTHMFNNPGILGSGAPYVYYSVYGFFKDRLGIEMGLEPGEDNTDWKRFNYRVESGYFLKNTDANFWRVSAEFKMGNDMVPIVSTLTTSNDGVRTLVPADAVLGIQSTRASGTPLSSLNIGDAKRWLFGFAGGFVDHGPHSFDISISQSVESESYNDNSSSKMAAIGGEARYIYNRTYGIQAHWSKYENFSYTDANAVKHDIPENPGWDVIVIRRLAMNYAFYAQYGNTNRAVLDQKYRPGNTWGLYMQYLW